MKTVLSIAGSDPCGGAGLQGDLLTIAAHGLHGMAVVTALTVQDTRGVREVVPVDAELVRRQLRTVLDDVPADAVVIGMLATGDVARAVADVLRDKAVRNVVLDPVMVSTSGHRLLDDDGVAAVREMLPLVTLVTPNQHEAAVLADVPTDALDDVLTWAARAPCAVLVTGGDADGDEVVDRYVEGDLVRSFRGKRYPVGPVRGTGGTLAAAIAARLALGEELEDACAGAIGWTRDLIANAENIGHGARVLGRTRTQRTPRDTKNTKRDA